MAKLKSITMGTIVAMLAAICAVMTVSPAQAVTYASSFTSLSTPEYTNSGTQDAVISGRVQPAAAGRPVSLYRVNSDGTSTYIKGTQTDGAGNFSITVNVTVYTKFKLYSGPQTVGADYYQGVTSSPFWIKSLRLWDSFDYSSWAEMDGKWDIRQEGLSPAGRTQTRSDSRALAFGGGVLQLRVVDDPENPGKYLVSHVTAGTLGIVRGHMEARIKFHRPPGAHGAMWWQAGYCEGGAEMDGVEFFGERLPHTSFVETQKVIHTIYDGWDPACQDTSRKGFFETWTNGDVDGMQAGEKPAYQNFNTANNSTWWDTYHTYSLFWNGDGYYFDIDGIRVGEVKDFAGATVPGEVILSLLASDWEIPALQDHLAAGGSVADYNMKVDWIRVWR